MPTQQHFSGPIRFAADGKIIGLLLWTCRKYPTELVRYNPRCCDYDNGQFVLMAPTIAPLPEQTVRTESPRRAGPQHERQKEDERALLHLQHFAGTAWGNSNKKHMNIRTNMTDDLTGNPKQRKNRVYSSISPPQFCLLCRICFWSNGLCSQMQFCFQISSLKDLHDSQCISFQICQASCHFYYREETFSIYISGFFTRKRIQICTHPDLTHCVTVHEGIWFLSICFWFVPQIHSINTVSQEVHTSNKAKPQEYFW